MTDMLTFDPTNINDIENFNRKLTSLKEDQITNDLLFFNLQKLLNILYKANDSIDDEHVNTTTKKLLVLLVNLTFKTKDRPVSLRENCIKNLDFYFIFKKLFQCYTHDTNSSVTIDDAKCECLALLIATINNLTFESEFIAKENIRNDIVRLCLDCLQTNNYLTHLNENSLTTKESLYLFDNIIRFLLSNCEELSIKHDLNRLGIIPIILDNKKKLDDALKRYPRMNELKIIDIRLVGILACLMDDNELEKYLKISQEIANKLLQILSETIKKSKSNTQMLNTKFYIKYEITNQVATYVYARSIIKRILNICVNDKIKQIIYDLNGLAIILKLLQNGNEREQLFCTELICSLCFNQQVRDCLKYDKRTLKFIEDLCKNTKNLEIKNACKQIVEMINHTLEKRLTTTPSASASLKPQSDLNNSVTGTGTVMISYNWKYKPTCVRLNEELKKRSFTTWIDVENMSDNLFDDMSKAVETCSVVLICYSEEYRKSIHCRLEAEYAFKLKKPMVFIRMQQDYLPQGWIALLMGQRVYVDFISGDANFDRQMDEVVKQISKATGSTCSRQQYNKLTSVDSVVASEQVKTDVKNWSSQDVMNWLSNVELDEFAKCFNEYDGVCLLALWNLKADCSDRFYSAIDEQINESDVTIPIRKRLLFYQHFSQLFSN